MKQSIRIDIVSDIVCPWCYIGKKRLEKAIHQLSGEFDFILAYHPFELNPNQPVSGVDNKQYLVDKFGSLDRYYSLTDHVTAIAAEEGLTFNYDKQEVSPNTRKAHALIQLAGETGSQVELVELLFKAYFTDGINLSDDKNLIQIGSEAGLSDQQMLAHLSNEDSLLQVALEEQRMYKLGISGVPFYIVNQKFGISGAQPADVLAKALQEIGSELPSVSK